MSYWQRIYDGDVFPQLLKDLIMTFGGLSNKREGILYVWSDSRILNRDTKPILFYYSQTVVEESEYSKRIKEEIGMDDEVLFTGEGLVSNPKPKSDNINFILSSRDSPYKSSR